MTKTEGNLVALLRMPEADAIDIDFESIRIVPLGASNIKAVQIPTQDEQAGIDWWNGLTEAMRAHWLKVANTAVPAEAWARFKTGTSNDHIDDLKDLDLAEQRLIDLRAGRSHTPTLDEVERDLGLAD